MTRYWHLGGYACTAAILVLNAAGCASYKSLVKPVTTLSVLSPELEDLSDFTIETYLAADARPAFPSTLAVAKVLSPKRARYYRNPDAARGQVEILRGDEAQGWRGMVGSWENRDETLIEQVQLISPLIVGDPVNLKSLRDAAALLHAPLLFVYIQDDNSSEGYNSAAMAYWTIVGLFLVPGNTVGHYTVCQGVLVDTRSGFILATTEGEAKREEHVLAGAVEIARDRVRERAQAEAVAALQDNFRETLAGLALSRGVRSK